MSPDSGGPDRNSKQFNGTGYMEGYGHPSAES